MSDENSLSDFLNEEIDAVIAYVQRESLCEITHLSFAVEHGRMKCTLKTAKKLTDGEQCNVKESIMNLGFNIGGETIGVPSGLIEYELYPYQAQTVVSRTYYRFLAKAIVKKQLIRNTGKHFDAADVETALDEMALENITEDFVHDPEFTCSNTIMPEMGERYIIR